MADITAFKPENEGGFLSPLEPISDKTLSKPDTLKLEFPAMARLIDDARTNGKDDTYIRKELARRESEAALYYNQEQINNYLGRTKQTNDALFDTVNNEKYQPYVDVMRHRLPREKVIDIVNTANYSGFAPSYLLTNHDNKQLMEEAERRAGERRGFFGQAAAAFSNMAAGLLSGKANRHMFLGEAIREGDFDDEKFNFIRYMGGDKAVQAERERLASAAERMSDWMRNLSDGMRSHVRPPDSKTLRTVFQAFENGGFSLESSVGKAIMWGLFGPLGGLASSAYFTKTEAETEGGEAFYEAVRRGLERGLTRDQAAKIAYQIGKNVKNKNIALLLTTNTLGDFLLHGMPDVFRDIGADLFPFKNFFGKFARGVVQYGGAVMSSALPEAVEEGAQEAIQQAAQGDEFDSGRIKEAAKMGYLDAVIFGLLGLGGRRAADRWTANRTDKRVQSIIDNTVRDLYKLEEQYKNGEANADSIVAQDPVVFVPKSRIDEQTAQALGLHEEVMEDEEGNEVTQAQQDLQVNTGIEENLEENLEETKEREESETVETPETDEAKNEAKSETEGTNETEEEEIAVLKSRWDAFAAENPQKAQELADVLREGVQGVTLKEQIARKLDSLRQAFSENTELVQEVERIKQEALQAGRDPEQAKELSTIAGVVANSINKQYGTDVRTAINLAFRSVNQNQNTEDAGTASEVYKQPSNIDELRTEQGHTIEEADMSEMLVTPDGSKTFGVIDEEAAKAIGLPKGAIQLDVHGLLHTLTGSHKKQIENAGYKNVESFFVDVLKNYQKIYEGQHGSLLLVKPLAKNNALAAIEANIDTEGYLAQTGWIIRDRGLKNKKLLFTRSESLVTNPAAGEVLQTASNKTGETDSNALLKSNADSITQVNASTSWPFGTSAAESQSIVEFFSTANKSSGFHELWHHVFRVLTDAAQLPDASDLLLHDVDVILKNAGVSREDFYGNVGDARRTAHEYFAKAGEAYLREGAAPTPELAGTFERIKQWLVEIYKNIKESLGIELNDEMRDIFDRLLATPEQLAEQKSANDIDTLYDATELQLKDIQDEIQRLNAQLEQGEDIEAAQDNKNEYEAVRRQYEGTAQWLKAPNGNDSKLSLPQWLQVRTPEFKKWFGDWEAVQTAREIQQMKAVPVTLSEKRLGKKEAEAKVASLGQMKNNRYGVIAVIPTGSVGKIIGHKGFNVMQIFDALPSLFENSVLILSEPEVKKEGHKPHSNIRAYHHFVNKFAADGTEYYIRFTAYEENTRKPTDKRIIHSTAISDVQVYKTNKKDAPHLRIRVSDPGVGEQASFVDKKIAQFFDSVNNVSQAVDENGEPLVVDIEGVPVFVNNHGDVRIAARYRAGYETYFQSDSDSQDSQGENKPKYNFKPDIEAFGYGGFLSVELSNGETTGFDVRFIDPSFGVITPIDTTYFVITNVKDNQWAYFYYPESDKFIPYMINLPEFNIKTPAKSIAKIREHMSAVEKAFKTNLDAYYSVRPFDGPSVEEWNNRPKAIGKSNDKGGWFISSRNFDIYETVPDGWSVVEGASVREGYALVSNNEPFYSGKRRAGLVPLSQVQNSQGSPAAKSAGLRPQYSKNIEEAEAGELLVKPDGSPALGYIDSSAAQAINAQEGEIRANVGVVRHTENRNHKAEIESAGYDLLEYLQDVLENWEEIRQGSKGFWLVKPLHDKHNGVAVVQFVQDKNGGSYKVVTMLYSRERSIKNKKLLYTRHPVSVISPGPDVNLTPAASSASAGKQTVKGEYLSEEQSFGEILSQKIEEAKKQSEKQLDDEILLATLNAKDISEQSFIRGKNKGEYYGIQEGREYQKKIDREKLKERIAKLKQTHKLMTERQRERQKIRTRSQKIRNSLKRMRQAKNIIWARQQEINTLLDTYDLKGMSLRELQFVHEQVKELYDTGKRELAAKKLLTQERVNKMRQEIMNTMQKDWDNRPRGASRHASDTSKEYNGLRGIKNKVIDWTMAHTMSAQRFFDFLDGGKKYQGAWSKYFSDEANKAYDEELRYKFARTLDLEAFMKEHGITAKKLAETRNVNVPHKTKGGWTVDELLSIYAGMKNERSRMAILYGTFDEAETIEQAEAWAADCVKALKEQEKALADFIIQEYEKHFDRINNRLIDVYNQGMQHEENYTPMRRIEFTSKRDGILDPDAAENLMSSQQGSGFRSVERGFTKSRQDISEKNQKGIELGLVSMWHSQVELQEHAAAFGQLVSDLRKILMARTKNDEATVRQMVKQTRGLPAWKMIRQYFNILATSDTLNAYDALDGIYKTMAKNMSVAYLCGNLGTILKQLGSFPRVLPYAGATSTLNALAQFMQNPNAFIEECYRLDPQLENRKGGDPLFRELRNGSDNLYDKALKAGYYLIGLADRAASAVVFKAVYDANIRKGLSHDDAVRQAQRVVLLTQPATHVKDKPLVWQQHGMARLAMMFTNDMAQTFGETVYDFVQSVRRGDKTEIVYRLTGLTLAAMFIKLVSSGLPDEPDDPQEWGKWITSAFVENELTAVPVIGKGLVTLWDYKRSMFGSQDPFVAPFAKLMQGVHGLWDDKNNNNERAVFNLIEGASLFAGFPSTALRRVWYASQELGHGNVLNAVKRAVGTRVENKKLKRAVSF